MKKVLDELDKIINKVTEAQVVARELLTQNKDDDDDSFRTAFQLRLTILDLGQQREMLMRLKENLTK